MASESLPLGPFGSGGATWDTLEAHVVETGLRNQLELLTELAAGRDAGLLITLDEIHHNQIDELREITAAVQHALREGRELAFVGAGLTSSVSGVVNDEVLTFLRRADRHPLGIVRKGDVRNSTADRIGRSHCR